MIGRLMHIWRMRHYEWHRHIEQRQPDKSHHYVWYLAHRRTRKPSPWR